MKLMTRKSATALAVASLGATILIGAGAAPAMAAPVPAGSAHTQAAVPAQTRVQGVSKTLIYKPGSNLFYLNIETGQKLDQLTANPEGTGTGTIFVPPTGESWSQTYSLTALKIDDSGHITGTASVMGTDGHIYPHAMSLQSDGNGKYDGSIGFDNGPLPLTIQT